MNYTVETDVFSGPLDLLLRLIERAELDITVIALAEVADNFLRHVRRLAAVEPDELADFVALAARLLVIKSRALLPRPAVLNAESAVDEADAEALAVQLRVYQQFRLAADLLRRREELGLKLFARLAAPPLPMIEIVAAVTDDAERLVAALQRRMRLTAGGSAPLTALVLTPRMTVREMVQRIVGRLGEDGACSFDAFLSDAAPREEVAVAFWAMLELNRRAIITIEQVLPFGPITLHPLALHHAPHLEIGHESS